MTKSKIIKLKPKIFKFKKGEYWDGDEMIVHYLEDILLNNNSKIKQDTYFTVLTAIRKEVKADD